MLKTWNVGPITAVGISAFFSTVLYINSYRGNPEYFPDHRQQCLVRSVASWGFHSRIRLIVPSSITREINYHMGKKNQENGGHQKIKKIRTTGKKVDQFANQNVTPLRVRTDEIHLHKKNANSLIHCDRIEPWLLVFEAKTGLSSARRLLATTAPYVHHSLIL